MAPAQDEVAEPQLTGEVRFYLQDNLVPTAVAEVSRRLLVRRRACLRPPQSFARSAAAKGGRRGGGRLKGWLMRWSGVLWRCGAQLKRPVEGDFLIPRACASEATFSDGSSAGRCAALAPIQPFCSFSELAVATDPELYGPATTYECAAPGEQCVPTVTSGGAGLPDTDFALYVTAKVSLAAPAAAQRLP